MSSNSSSPSQTQRVTRLIITLFAISALGWAILFTGRLALSRIFVAYAMATRDSLGANEAVRLSFSDAETHYTRGTLLKLSGFGAEAIDELEAAVSLRPRDHVLWLELGMTREEQGDQDGALAAMNEAVRLAPYYAVPRWQRGNLLLRMRRYDEAFADLRTASQSNPEFIRNLIDLAWGFSQSDSAVAQQLADINTPAMHATFALYLARRGRPKESLEQLQLAGDVSAQMRRDVVAALLEYRAFREAYGAWAGGNSDRAAVPSLHDGSFEAPLSLDESGFGWRVPRGLQGAQLSHDTEGPHDGAKSLRVEFTGESNPQSALLSQLIITEPSKTYQLTFASRTKELVTGGGPIITVVDGTDRKVLIQSGFGKQSSAWEQQTVVFTTGASTSAVVVTLQREGCPAGPCPAFGTLWLDSFSLQPITNPQR